MKPVAIVANNPVSWVNAPFDNTDIDIWAFNNYAAKEFPRIDALFQIHEAEIYKEVPAHWGWLKNNRTIPVYMGEIDPEVPMGIRYPREEVFAMLSHVMCEGEAVRLLTSSVSLAIALAILQQKSKIFYYGIEMALGREYGKQREGLAFWTGFAAGRGIELDIRCAKEIFVEPVYGLR